MTASRTPFQGFRQGIREQIQRVLASPLAEALTTPHGVDRYLEYFNPAWSVSEVRATITEIRYQTRDTVTLRLKPNSNWQGFAAGQYVRLTVEIDGALHTRCFSPANAEGDDHIELTAKLHGQAFVTKYLRERAEPGTVVTLSQADGEFALPKARPQRVVLIGGGSGITPVMAILRTLCAEGHTGEITFLHYANSAADALYADELAEIASAHDNVTVHRAYGDDKGDLQGLFCRAHLEATAADFADAESFLCGPPPMMDAVQKLYEAEGLASRLHSECFSLAVAPAPADEGEAEGEIRFAHSERVAANDGDTLLNQAEAAGLKPKAGCRMGICHACTCRKTSGRVRDLRNGQISDAGEGEVQICVSVPVGTVTLDL